MIKLLIMSSEKNEIDTKIYKFLDTNKKLYLKKIWSFYTENGIFRAFFTKQKTNIITLIDGKK